MRKCISILLLLLFTAGSIGAEPKKMVLVTHVDNSITYISPIELRKLYLGLTVHKNDSLIQAFRNLSNQKLDQIFLQNVVSMSEKSYKRRLLSLTFRFGTPPPISYTLQTDLIEALKIQKNTITYMWEEDLARLPQMKIIKVLWIES